MVGGFLVPTYKDKVEVLGSVQAISAKEKKYLGMSSTKETLEFWFRLDSTIANGINHTGSSKLVFKGKEYILIEGTNWHALDGWCKVVGVQHG